MFTLRCKYCYSVNNILFLVSIICLYVLVFRSDMYPYVSASLLCLLGIWYFMGPILLFHPFRRMLSYCLRHDREVRSTERSGAKLNCSNIKKTGIVIESCPNSSRILYLFCFSTFVHCIISWCLIPSFVIGCLLLV